MKPMIRRFDNYDLSQRNTFRMRVSCACFVEYDSVSDLRAIDWGALPRPVLHIGAGSNLLFTGDFPGTVLHSCIKFYKEQAFSGEDCLVEVGAGVTFDDFCARCADAGLWGPENLSGIPGEAGAAAVQNIGAYGVEAGDIISAVRCFDVVTGEDVSFAVGDCAYAYRDSAFKHAPFKGRYIVTSVLFHLTGEYSPRLGYGRLAVELGDSGPLTPDKVRAAVLQIRDGKLPDPAKTGSAGSFFKNPVVLRSEYERICAVAEAEAMGEVPHWEVEGGIKVSAAWLIDRCGLKGLRRGGAEVYGRQPLVIVNQSGDALPQDVLEVEAAVSEAVARKFNIRLSAEVEHIA